MAVELDHDAIKTRIVDILKANATLFDANDLTKIRFIEVGFPDGDPFLDQMFDYIFITNSTPFETIRNQGATPTSASKSIVTNLEHTFHYDIVTVVNAKSARDAELKLDDFQKLTLELLEAEKHDGFSDHTVGLESCVRFIQRKGEHCIIEKHVMLPHTISPDVVCSITVQDLAYLMTVLTSSSDIPG